MRALLAFFIIIGLADCVATNATNALPPAAGDWLEAAVRLEAAGGHGSGIVVGPNLILTAKHVAAHADDMTATFYDGEQRAVRRVWSDDTQDIALVAFDGEPYGTIMSVSCALPKWGERFWWIGQPAILEWMIRSGYIASPEPDKPTDTPEPTILVVAQFVGGDSGSGIISLDGQIIGVVTAAMGNGSQLGGISAVSTVCGKLHEQSAAIHFAGVE